MSIVIFCGPTLPRDRIQSYLNADVRPPAARGDVLRAALERPSAIGLVDGYFDRVPSVWHKEILWAMSTGINVFGSASMGALRAAELAHFGMVGIGTIFELFRTGTLVDDDEVAVAHASEEFGYRATSEAMVNIRLSLQAAHRERIISLQTLKQLETIGKRTFYPERRFEVLLREGLVAQLPHAEIHALRDWLPSGQIDQKRDDAVSMLLAMAERDRNGWEPQTVDYVFAHTDAWEALSRAVRWNGAPTALHGNASGTEIMDELLVSGLAGRTRHAAFVRAISLELARQGHIEIDPKAVQAVADDFRRERGLLEPEQFDEWLKVQQLDETEIASYFRREAVIRKVKERMEAEMLSHVVDHLRATGEYGPIAYRARAKEEFLRAHGLICPELCDTKMSETALWQWYFGERLGHAVPEDLRAFALRENADLNRLRLAVIREQLFVSRSNYSAGAQLVSGA